ncbi:uncharacterized protein LOC116345565 [Contarinia nasturtii]|uniref:uncharacterized protein LOC116345565 n=1 Tax=Contarinia nasturtii TaxID=265458 RepID=UPI0012D41713|nr:uncharacterized protein LOC116345565 [Contarinia nasturtii]
MFYVVYLINPRLNVIVPQKWILNHEKQLEKDMFFGVNSNQVVLCYYSSDAYNHQGEPDTEILPNFNLPIDCEFPNEGCYKAKIKVFKMNFDDALAYAQRQRQRNPPVYNVDRLFELPIPALTPDQNNAVDPLNVDDNVDLNGTGDGPPIEHASEEANNLNGGNENIVDLQPCNNDEESNTNDNMVTGTINTDGLNQQSISESMVENHTENFENVTRANNGTDQRNVESMAEEHTENIENATGANDETNELSGGELMTEEHIENFENATGANDETNEQPDGEFMTEEHNENITLGNDEIDQQSGGSSQFDNNIENLADATMSNGNNQQSDLLFGSIKGMGVPYIARHTQNNDAINELLENTVENRIDDDVSIMIGAAGVPKPMFMTSDELVKRENDILSGNKPYNEIDGGDRIYLVGGIRISIPLRVINAFKSWVDSPDADNLHFDEIFVHTLLLTMVTAADLVASEISDPVLSFIFDLLAIRVKDDESRLEKFNAHVNRLVEKKRREQLQRK